MNLALRWVAVGLSFGLAGACSGGCGGASVGLSGPDSHTSTGLGTLVVSVRGQSQNVALVLFQNQTQRASSGKAYFYNVAPGRYTVGASPELHGTLLGYDRHDVDIVADKTVSLTLTPRPVPFATSTPFALKSQAQSLR